MRHDDLICTEFPRRDCLAALGASALPIYIYGAGEYAKAVWRFLRKYGFDVAGHVVDRGYRLDATVLELDELAARQRDYALVIGMADHRKARQRLQRWGRLDEGRIHHVVLSPHYLDDIDDDFLAAHRAQLERVLELIDDTASRTALTGFIKTVHSGDDRYLFDAASPDQYFPDFIAIAPDEVFVDGGAYTGDTVADFRRRSRDRFGKYYAFEPDPRNFAALLDHVPDARARGIELRPAALADRAGELRLVLERNASTDSRLGADGELTIQALTIDQACADASFIKLDVEGGEADALRGARATIVRNRPKLAICAYHAARHLWELPLFVRALRPDYRIRFRQHRTICTELVMYAY